MEQKTKGILLGMLGSCAYGTNPLFTLPLYTSGLGVNSVLFYRYLLAVSLYGIWLVFFKKESLKASPREILYLLPLGVLFAFSSLTMFSSYHYIAAGVASSILFVYPIIVALIMSLFYKEKINVRTSLSIFLMICGIAFLYKGNNGVSLNLYGVLLVLISALSYAVYMVALKKIPTLGNLKYFTLTFYVMFFGMFVFLFNLKFGLEIQPLNTPFMWLCMIALALLPTIVSLETLTVSVRIIGPTLAAILGALKPVTAVFIGFLFFNEPLTLRIAAGIMLIIFSVFLIALKKA